jgi:hypothetical protein
MIENTVTPDAPAIVYLVLAETAEFWFVDFAKSGMLEHE